MYRMRAVMFCPDKYVAQKKDNSRINITWVWKPDHSWASNTVREKPTMVVAAQALKLQASSFQGRIRIVLSCDVEHPTILWKRADHRSFTKRASMTT